MYTIFSNVENVIRFAVIDNISFCPLYSCMRLKHGGSYIFYTKLSNLLLLMDENLKKVRNKKIHACSPDL